jgi:xanthine dehydrogenase molybdopterin-binding subunit B
LLPCCAHAVNLWLPLLLLQVYVASTLGVPMNKLVCKTKRIGGGFGGKETRRWVCTTLITQHSK